MNTSSTKVGSRSPSTDTKKASRKLEASSRERFSTIAGVSSAFKRAKALVFELPNIEGTLILHSMLFTTDFRIAVVPASREGRVRSCGWCAAYHTKTRETASTAESIVEKWLILVTKKAKSTSNAWALGRRLSVADAAASEEEEGPSARSMAAKASTCSARGIVFGSLAVSSVCISLTTSKIGKERMGARHSASQRGALAIACCTAARRAGLDSAAVIVRCSGGLFCCLDTSVFG